MGSINIFKPLSTFLLPAPLINLSKIDHFSFQIYFGMLGIKPGAAGWEASMCYAAPHGSDAFGLKFQSPFCDEERRFRTSQWTGQLGRGHTDPKHLPGNGGRPDQEVAVVQLRPWAGLSGPERRRRIRNSPPRKPTESLDRASDEIVPPETEMEALGLSELRRRPVGSLRRSRDSNPQLPHGYLEWWPGSLEQSQPDHKMADLRSFWPGLNRLFGPRSILLYYVVTHSNIDRAIIFS